MEQQNQKVTWAQMVRDVLITSINRGQLPLVIVLILCVIPLFRMPESDLSRLVFSITEGLQTGYLIGYLLSIVLLILWYFNAKKARKQYSELEKECKQLLAKSNKRGDKK